MAFTLSLIIGCDQNSVGARQNMPASTMPVLDRIDECEDNFHRSWDNIDQIHLDCQEDPNRDYEECNNEYDENLDQIQEGRLNCLTNLPQVPGSCVEQLEPFGFEHDTDGDGIDDYWEYQMGLNPCEKCSYGGIPGVDCDADLDYDRDGIPNGIDYNPMCGHYWEDSEWHFLDELPEGSMSLSDGYCI